MDSITRGALIHGGGNFSAFSPSPSRKQNPPPKNLSFSVPGSNGSGRVVCASSNADRVVPKLKSAASALILTAATAAALLTGKLASPPPARAKTAAPSPPPPATEEKTGEEIESRAVSSPTALSQFLESNADAVDSLRSLLYQKLEDGEDSEALKILERLMAVRPAETEWKFLAARLLNEMGRMSEARKLFEDILAKEPFSFEALFENAVLMDRCGEGKAAIKRLEKALEAAKAEKKEKEARDVRLIVAQIQFLQKKVDEALKSYDELAKEDPKDYRPYFCQGVIYSLLDRNDEARKKFAKYKELSPRTFEVEGFLQTPLSRVKLFGTGDSEN